MPGSNSVLAYHLWVTITVLLSLAVLTKPLAPVLALNYMFSSTMGAMVLLPDPLIFKGSPAKVVTVHESVFHVAFRCFRSHLKGKALWEWSEEVNNSTNSLLQRLGWTSMDRKMLVIRKSKLSLKWCPLCNHYITNRPGLPNFFCAYVEIHRKAWARVCSYHTWTYRALWKDLAWK